MFSLSFLNGRYCGVTAIAHTYVVINQIVELLAVLGAPAGANNQVIATIKLRILYYFVSAQSNFFLDSLFLFKNMKHGNLIELARDLPLSNYFISNYICSSRLLCVLSSSSSLNLLDKPVSL